LCNVFLNVKQARVDSGELSARTWVDNKEACDLVVTHFGKQRLVSDLRPDDFNRLRAKMAQQWGPVRLGNVVHRIKSVFKYALASGLIERPVLYGPDFTKPSAGVIRRHRAKNGERMLEPAELRALAGGALVVGGDGPELVRATPQLRAMILLGINCG